MWVPVMNMSGEVRTTPDHPFVLPMEANFDRVKTHIWIVDKFGISVVSSLIYVIVLFFGQRVMKSRQPLDLKRLLVLWNGSLALFSVLVSSRMLPELFHVLQHFGWRHSICSFGYYDDSPVSGLWAYLFALSKIVELLDTLFLILRKRRVVFLHWFHHCSVLVFTWFLLKDKAGFGRWFMSMNALVHAVMYGYYAVMALQIKLPKYVALGITTSQISQMIFGSFVSLQGFIYWMRNEKCGISGTAAISSILIYGAYLLLFLNFFIQTYVVKKPRPEKKTS